MGRTHYRETPLDRVIRQSELIVVGKIVNKGNKYQYSENGFVKEEDVSTAKDKISIQVGSMNFRIEGILHGREDQEEIEVITTANYGKKLRLKISYVTKGIRRSPVYHVYKRSNDAMEKSEKLVLFLKAVKMVYSKEGKESVVNEGAYKYTMGGSYESYEKLDEIKKLITTHARTRDKSSLD